MVDRAVEDAAVGDDDLSGVLEAGIDEHGILSARRGVADSLPGAGIGSEIATAKLGDGVVGWERVRQP